MSQPALDRHQIAFGIQYRLHRIIGWGGLATTYLAHDIAHDRLVALKVLEPAAAAHLGRERFIREIAVVAGLRHPFILSVQAFGELPGGELWLTTPYVECESLRDRLRRETRLPVDDALRLMRAIAEALAYAHGRGVVHRDIKPENILLVDDHAAVTGFEMAHVLTGPRLVLGTPGYLSPEQLSGNPAVDPRSDVYALGAVLSEMLKGATLPGALGATIRRALARDPNERYASAAEFRAAL